MPRIQLFRRSSNSIFRLSIVAIIGFAAFSFTAAEVIKWSPYQTEVGVPLLQPVPFSHRHHVGGLGIDCRYCHSTVETSSSAGFPSTKTCMTCHSQIWQQSLMLKPVRDSYANRKPLHWNRVYRIPRFVYFNHSIHVQKGVGCTTCHGNISEMPLTWKERTFYMRDCLSCHREPEKYHVKTNRIMDCYTCHR